MKVVTKSRMRERERERDRDRERQRESVRALVCASFTEQPYNPTWLNRRPHDLTAVLITLLD